VPGITEVRAIPGKPRSEKPKKVELSGKSMLVDRVTWTSGERASELLVFEDGGSVVLLEIREDPADEHPRVNAARLPRLLYNAEIVIAGMDEEAQKQGARMISRGAWSHVTRAEARDDAEDEAETIPRTDAVE
jgi:hypothetical protein